VLSPRAGPNNDYLPTPLSRQEVITRYRVFGGAKLKFGILAVVAQYELYLAGHSRDDNTISTVDQSGRQSAFSLSTGLEF